MDKKLAEAVLELRGECASHEDCDGFPFYGPMRRDKGSCAVRGIPISWEKETVEKAVEISRESFRRKMAARTGTGPAAGWISVAQELPDEYEAVLVYGPEIGSSTSLLLGDGRFAVDWSKGERSVTHWRPIPAPPGDIDSE